MKITYTETGIYEHERIALDKIKKVFDSGFKTKDWRAYAGFQFMHNAGRDKGVRELDKYEFDLLIITHANILVIELKDWNGKKITKSAGKWYLDNKELDTCPIEKNIKKMHLITNKLKDKVKEKREKGITFHYQSVSHFVVMCGKADYSTLPPEDLAHILSLDEFLKLADQSNFNWMFRQHLERDGRIYDIKKEYHGILDEIFANDQIQPRSIILNNHERGDVLLPHPNKIYTEYKAQSTNIIGEKSLMRCWDFNALSGSNSKMNQRQHRFDFICNERQIYQRIKSEKPDLYLICLHPITNPTLDDMTSKYNELYEIPETAFRTNEFIRSYASKLSKSEKYDLFQIMISKFNDLHAIGIVHGDIGEHSIWLSYKMEVTLSNFTSASDQLRPSRIGEELVDILPIYNTASQRPALELTAPQQDVYWLGLLIFHIMKNQRLSGKSLKDFNPNLLDQNDWFDRVLSRALTGGYENAIEFFSDYLLEKPDVEVSYKLDDAVLDPFLTQVNIYDSYPMAGAPIQANAEFMTYASGNNLVKFWGGKVVTSMTTYQKGCYKRFFEELKDIKSLKPTYLPEIIDFGLSTITASAYLVTATLSFDTWQNTVADLTDEEKEGLVVNLLQAIKNLHGHEYYHGHLSDQNILVDRANLQVVFTDSYHPVPVQGDSSSPYYATDIEDPTAMQCDNYAALKLIAGLYDINLNTELDSSQDQKLAWLSQAFSTELSEDVGVRYIDNTRFMEAFECKDDNVKKGPQISIYSNKVDTAFTIYPENGKLYIQLESAKEGDIRVTFSGINGTAKGFYKPHEQQLSFLDTLLKQDLWWRASKEASCSVDATIHVNPVSGRNKRDNIIELSDFLQQDQGFLDALELFNYAKQVQRLDELAATQAQLHGLEPVDDNDIVQVESLLGAIPTQNVAQSGISPLYDISTKDLWKKVMVAERHAHPSITLSGPLKKVENKHHFNSKSVVAFYDSDEDVSAKFSSTDKIDVMCTRETGRGGDYTFCIGTMNIAQSRVGELWIDFFNDKNSVPVGSTLFLQSKADKSSNRKRADALKNILGNDARIQNLIDYFEPALNIEADDYGVEVTDEQFDKYNVYDNDSGKLIKSLNPLQRVAFRQILNHGPISMLKGPPGTGKTEFISTFAHFLYEVLNVGNILIVSQSHEAVNESVERIRKQFLNRETEISIARISNKESAVSDGLKDVYTGSIITAKKELFKSNMKQKIVSFAEVLDLDADYLRDLYTLRLELNNLKVAYGSIDQDDLEQKISFSSDEYQNAFEKAMERFKVQFSHDPNLLNQLQKCIDDKESTALNRLNNIEVMTFDALNQYHGISSAEGRNAQALINIAFDYEPLIDSPSANYESFLVKTRQLICGTCVGVGQQSIGIANQVFDWVIIDEAARSISSELAIAMQSGKRILLVGDQNQLPPLYSTELKKALAVQLGIKKDDLDHVLQSDFGRIFDSHYGQQASAEILTQYRMSPSIGNLVSDCFYKGKLELGVVDSRFKTVEELEKVELKRIVPDIYYSEIATELNSTVTWVDTGNAEHFNPEKGSSIYNPHEIDQIIDFLQRIDKDKPLLQRLMPKPGSVQEPVIGVICTYAEQKNRLRKAFALSDISNELRSLVRIDTVDSYQGKENRIIILSVTRNDPTKFPAFLKLDNRVNVALSRAMDRLVIFGASEMWQGINSEMPLGRVLTYIQAREEDESEYQFLNKRARNKKVQSKNQNRNKPRRNTKWVGV